MPDTRWKPMRSAPKDGRAVLLFAGHVTIGYWDKDINFAGKGGWTDGTVASWGYEEIAVLKPTHWMALPDPPEEATK